MYGVVASPVAGNNAVFAGRKLNDMSASLYIQKTDMVLQFDMPDAVGRAVQRVITERLSGDLAVGFEGYPNWIDGQPPEPLRAVFCILDETTDFRIEHYHEATEDKYLDAVAAAARFGLIRLDQHGNLTQ